MSTRSRFAALCWVAFWLLAGCGRPRKADYVVLSYPERSTFCIGCPVFRIELRAGGDVNLFGQYRDEIRIHEVVDGGRPLATLSRMEKDFRDTVHVERYLTPSLALYREPVKSGWDVNTRGEDHENALAPAALAGDAASVAFLLQSGATVSPYALQFSVHSKSIDVFRLLAAAKKVDYGSAEGGSLLLSATGAGNIPLLLELLDRGAPVDARQPRSEDTPLPDGPNRPLACRSRNQHRHDRTVDHHGADPDLPDKEGRTALMTAAGLCWYWDVEALLAKWGRPPDP